MAHIKNRIDATKKVLHAARYTVMHKALHFPACIECANQGAAVCLQDFVRQVCLLQADPPPSHSDYKR